jgi:hypothetical protein
MAAGQEQRLVQPVSQVDQSLAAAEPRLIETATGRREAPDRQVLLAG